MSYPKYLYGLHDPGGHHLMADAPGTVVYTIDVYNDTPVDFSAQFAAGFRAIVRLNHSHHGQGTIPPGSSSYEHFASGCAAYVDACRGVRDFTIGNEPNIRAEWGREDPITPEQYAECYRMVYQAIKQRTPAAQIAPAAIGPWNVESGIEWVEYFGRVLAAAGLERVDWINLHTYSRGYDPRSVTDNSWMDAPYQNRHNGFRAYKDFLDAVPAVLRALPVDITETNGNEEWPDQNTGWVQSAYAEIDRHNRLAGTQKIRSLCLFRWPHFEGQPWGIEHKAGVHADFRDAVAHKYPSPTAQAAAAKPETETTLNLPAVQVNGPVFALPPRDIDERLRARGVGIAPADVVPGAHYWRLVRALWMDESQAGGRHHIYIDALDEAGQRVVGEPFVVNWPSGSAVIRTEAKPGEPWATSFNMGPSRNEYGIRPIADPADAVNGIGMGADTPGGFNAGIHTSTGLVYQWTRMPQPERPPAPVVPRPQPGNVPALVHPVQDPAHRRVSQPFGVNPERYARWNLDGHAGIDFATPMGTAICAVAPGVPVEVANDPGGYGLYVKLRHPWGESLYAHLDGIPTPEVLPGRTVRAGQLIGLSGNTGNSTGPHLHFGMRINPYTRGLPFDGYSDPSPYLQGTVEPVNIPQVIRAAAREFGLAEALLLSLCWKESSFRTDVTNPAGARGLGQIVPSTWDEWSVKVGAKHISDARDNARVAAAYLDFCIRNAGGVRRGLWAYVWGIGRVLELGAPGQPTQPPAEVLEYANTIIHGRDLMEAVNP